MESERRAKARRVRFHRIARIVLFSFLVSVCVSQNFEITRLNTVIYERDNSTFVLTPEGKDEVNVSPTMGVQVKYKGVWINSELLKAIDARFGKDAETMKAILIVESQSGGVAQQNAVNHNCRYDSKGNLRTDGKGYSGFCKSEYHAKIGTDSVDCGYLQINVKGNVCPKDIFTPKRQVEVAYEIYSEGGCGGLNCWSSYKYSRSKITSVLNQS